jgi:hypothetical protein
MRLPDDDELYRVDETYLGPPGRYIGEMRHTMLFSVVIIAPLVFVTAKQLGVPMSLMTAGVLFLGSVWVAMKAADHLGPDTSAKTVGTTWLHELTSPRSPDGQVQQDQAGPVFDRAVRPSRAWAAVLQRRQERAEQRWLRPATSSPEPSSPVTSPAPATQGAPDPDPKG